MSIQINDTVIESRTINIESAHHQEPGGDPRIAMRRAAVALSVRELLRQRAESLGLGDEGNSDSDAVIEQLLAQEVAVPGADEATCRRWFEGNPARFRTPDLAEVRHILLAAPPEDLPARDAARTTAETLIAQLREEPDGFAKLAREYSRCPSADDGGWLGQVSSGETVPEFEEAVLRLPIGLAHTPIKTRYGFHVVEVLQRVDGKALPFEAVHEQIAGYLEETAYRRAVSQYLRLLAGEADIRGIDLDASESLLVQ